MSHSLIFMKFKNGESIGYDKNKLFEILKRHICNVTENEDGSCSVFFTRNGESETIGSEGIIYLDGNMVESFNIDRPYYDPSLYALWFDILNDLDVCSFPDCGGELFATKDISIDLPEGLIDSCENGITIVQTVDKLYRGI